MDVKEFVFKTIKEVTEGVRQARDHEIGQRSNKDSHKWTEIGTSQITDRNNLKFDIAVTVQEGSESDANGGIKVVGVHLGGGGGKSSLTETVSRIQFEVPIGFPST